MESAVTADSGVCSRVPPYPVVHTTVGGALHTEPVVTGVWESLMRGSLTGTPSQRKALVVWNACRAETTLTAQIAPSVMTSARRSGNSWARDGPGSPPSRPDYPSTAETADGSPGCAAR